jgi:hypothetical protein
LLVSSTTTTKTPTTTTQVNIDQYLTHYWPITSGQMTNQISSAHMTQGSLTTFVPDRFGNPNSALNLNGGWTQVPSGNYFNTREFTISVWVYPQQVGLYSRVIDFGNGPGPENVILAIASENITTPLVEILSAYNIIIQTISTQSLVLNAWQFLTATFDGINSRIYINGTLAKDEALSSTFTMPIVTRINCFVGKSPWAADGVSFSYLDSLRFYNASLTQAQIIELMNKIDTGNVY